MLHTEDWMDIHTLHREGHTIKSLARLTGHARNTVRKMLRANPPPEAPAGSHSAAVRLPKACSIARSRLVLSPRSASCPSLERQ